MAEPQVHRSELPFCAAKRGRPPITPSSDKNVQRKRRNTCLLSIFHQTTTLTPEQYVAGLTDFGPGRSKLFGNSADEYLKVHQRGRTQADVTEGSGGIWERLHYDWSDPNHVVLTTTDSNLWGGASGHTYTFTRQPDGTTEIDVAVVRDGKNLKGRLLGFVLGPSAGASWKRRLKQRQGQADLCESRFMQGRALERLSSHRT